MNANRKAAATCVLLMGLLFSGCGPGQAFGATVTPIPTATSAPTTTSIPTSTNTPTQIPTVTPTLAPTMTSTPTPAPLCNPGTVVTSPADNSLPGYLDIVQASSKLDGMRLYVTLTLRELPEQIEITKNPDLSRYISYYQWGVDIDIDNNPSTGFQNNFTDFALGIEYLIQTGISWDASYKGTVKSLTMKSAIPYGWTGKLQPPYLPLSKDNAKVIVDLKQKTITLNGYIPGINKNSSLIFFAKHNLTNETFIYKTICFR